MFRKGISRLERCLILVVRKKGVDLEGWRIEKDFRYVTCWDDEDDKFKVGKGKVGEEN